MRDFEIIAKITEMLAGAGEADRASVEAWLKMRSGHHVPASKDVPDNPDVNQGILNLASLLRKMDQKYKLRGEHIMISSMGKKRRHHEMYNGSSFVKVNLYSPLHMMALCPSCEREMAKVANALNVVEEHDVGNWFCECCNTVKSPLEEIPICTQMVGEVLRIFDLSDPVVMRIQVELCNESGWMSTDMLEATIDAAGFKLAESRGLEINEGVRYRFTMFPGNIRRICGIEPL